MIAKTSSGASFHALGRYLAVGRNGTEPERVAWSTARHLPVADPQLAASIMRATAQQNGRVVKPVYHLSVSFDPRDAATRDTMEHVVDRILHRLGLADHQALLVAHHDRTHPHVHVMVNRVHPETGRAWERWQDRPLIEQVLRQCERELGLRQVAGRLTDEPGVDRPGRVTEQGYSSGERRKYVRGEPLLVDRMREQAEALRAAPSWRAFEAMLADQGWHVARRGQGLVIGDGTQYVKASRIHRKLSLFQLERKFGVAYAEGGKDPLLPPRVARAVYAARTLHDVDTQLAKAYTSRLSVADAKSVVERLDRLAEHKRTVSREFSRALTSVYRDVRAARRAFEAMATVDGVEVAARRMHVTPEQFGVLRIDRGPRRLFGRTHLDDASARQAAHEAADRGVCAVEAARQAPTREMRRAAQDGVWVAARRHHGLGRRLHAFGPRQTIDAALRQTVRVLVPPEMRMVATLLTRSQYTVVAQVRSVANDILLGRDGGMER